MQATSIKTKAARNKLPRKESTPETEDCECKTYSVKVEEGKFGCGVPRSMAHGLINIAELFGVHFFTFSWEIYPVFDAKTLYFLLFIRCNERSLVYVNKIIIIFFEAI